MNSFPQRDRSASLAEGEDPRELLRAAARHHAAGRVEQARFGYQRVLRIDPDQPDALHLLGVLSGDCDAGIELVSKAISISPTMASYHASLAKLLKSKGRLDDAIGVYERALELEPGQAELHNNLGVALRAAGRIDHANERFREAIRLKPALAEAWNNLGHGLVSARQFDEAVQACEKAAALKANYAEAFHNLGTALAGKGQSDEAAAAYRRAIEIAPNYADGHNNLANVLRSIGRLEEAIAEYKIAIGLKAGYFEAHNNLAVAEWEAGREQEAIATIMRALELKPDFAEAYNSLGNMLKAHGELDRALGAYQRALEFRTDYAEAMSNLAVVLKDQGRHEEAMRYAARSIEIQPDHAAHGNLIYLLHFHPEAGPEAIAREQAEWDRIHAQPLRQNVAAHRNDNARNRRLRIGYIGPYFRKHVVGLNVLPLLREHDHSRFEIFCYSDVMREDDVTRACRGHADHWRNILGMSDSQVDERVRADGIDILIDLVLHMSGNRLLVLARKPAPVQATFAGYPGGTGLRTIDYRISDPYLDPAGADESCYVEKIARLPKSFWCYDEAAMTMGMSAMPEVGPPPARNAGVITFGCLNNFCKINDRVLGLWARVMNAVPNSRLLLLAPTGIARERVLDRLGACGVACWRVEFVAYQPREKYFDLYNRIDLGLDTFPYDGHSTSLDSLWMGVPVVTLAGEWPVGRAGVSQLSNLEMTEFIARDEEHYVRIAAEFASDLNRLARVRAGLRERMRASALMDAKGFARGIENAYRAMWEERRA